MNDNRKKRFTVIYEQGDKKAKMIDTSFNLKQLRDQLKLEDSQIFTMKNYPIDLEDEEDFTVKDIEEEDMIIIQKRQIIQPLINKKNYQIINEKKEARKEYLDPKLMLDQLRKKLNLQPNQQFQLDDSSIIDKSDESEFTVEDASGNSNKIFIIERPKQKPKKKKIDDESTQNQIIEQDEKKEKINLKIGDNTKQSVKMKLSQNLKSLREKTNIPINFLFFDQENRLIKDEEDFTIEDIITKDKEIILREEEKQNRKNKITNQNSGQQNSGQQQSSFMLKISEQLENILAGIKPLIDEILSKFESKREIMEKVKQNEQKLADSKNFEIEQEETYFEKKDLKAGIHANICLYCNRTCHENCQCKESYKYNCIIFNKNGYCTVCPMQCNWSYHKKIPYIFEQKTRKVTTTLDQLKNQYLNALNNISNLEQIKNGLQNELQTLSKKLFYSLKLMRESQKKLDEIVLRPKIDKGTEMFQRMIQTELEQKKPGFMQRMNALCQFQSFQKILDQSTQKSDDELFQEWTKYYEDVI